MNTLQVKKYYLLILFSFKGKALQKQRKTVEDQREKQIKALEKHGKQLIMFGKK